MRAKIKKDVFAEGALKKCKNRPLTGSKYKIKQDGIQHQADAEYQRKDN
jgi:hypothetical protein